MSIEVTITPGRTGRVGIRVGDNVELVAKNFCKAYSLDKEMEHQLTMQLKGHLSDYYQRFTTKPFHEQLNHGNQKVNDISIKKFNPDLISSCKPTTSKEFNQLVSQMNSEMKVEDDGKVPMPVRPVPEPI